MASLREAFGPGTGYWRANTAADTLADWVRYRSTDPGLTLRGYVRLLLNHETARWGTPAWPLMRRLVTYLRCYDGERTSTGRVIRPRADTPHRRDAPGPAE